LFVAAILALVALGLAARTFAKDHAPYSPVVS
jgi:hypothetical protein